MVNGFICVNNLKAVREVCVIGGLMMYGAGSVKEVRVGRYLYYAARYYDDAGKQKAKRFPHTKQGEAEAKRFLKEVCRKKDAGVKTCCNWTVAGWVEYYIRVYKANSLRDSSLERLIQSYTKIAVSPIGGIALDRIKGSTIQNFYNLLAEQWTDETGKVQKPLSSSSISKVHKLLVSAFKKAMQEREISFDPMTTVSAVKVHTKEMSVFSWREIGRIFHALRKIKANVHNSKQTHDYRLLFRMLLETGCRISELLALRWSDVNFAKREIHIHRSKAKNGQTFNDPKTAAGKRYVPIIFDKLLAMLKEYRCQNNIIKMEGFIFESRNGNAICYRRVLECWQHVQKLTGIEKNIHCFRHTAATFLLERQVPVAEVSRILGHSDPTITYSMYTHAIPGYNQKIIQMLQRKTTNKTQQVQKQVQII